MRKLPPLPFALATLSLACAAGKQPPARPDARPVAAHAGSEDRAVANAKQLASSKGDLEAAAREQRKVLEVQSRTLPDDHPDLQITRQSLAGTLAELGDLAGTRALYEKILAVQSRTLPRDHPDLLRAQWNVAANLALFVAASRASAVDTFQHPGMDETLFEQRFDSLIRSFADGLRHSAMKAIVASSSREAEERISSRATDLGYLLSAAPGLGIFTDQALREREALLASETMRSAALSSARLARRARADPDYEAKRSRVREITAELDRLARAGAAAEDLSRAQRDLETAERELVRRAASLSGGPTSLLMPEIEELSADLRADEAIVAYRSYDRLTIETGETPVVKSVRSLCAFVLRRSSPSAAPGETGTGGLAWLERVELGPIETIETAVQSWRESVGAAAERGVPRSAGQKWAQGEILRGLVLDPLKRALTGITRAIVVPDDVLHAVALDALPTGDVWRPRSGTAKLGPPFERREPFGTRIAIEVRSSLFERMQEGGLPVGDASLLAIGAEVRAIGDLFKEVFGSASLGNSLELAPKARFLHVATHGGFAPAAEELSSLDLSRCELAVLSACDENVGVRLAGQGVASLQRALHMAGARSVITSLWKVPDEATKELMVDFYRRIWVEKQPKALALWEAKMKLRAAKDEAGKPRYSTRDWAGWVLTGDPR